MAKLNKLRALHAAYGKHSYRNTGCTGAATNGEEGDVCYCAGCAAFYIRTDAGQQVAMEIGQKRCPPVMPDDLKALFKAFVIDNGGSIVDWYQL